MERYSRSQQKTKNFSHKKATLSQKDALLAELLEKLTAQEAVDVQAAEADTAAQDHNMTLFAAHVVAKLPFLLNQEATDRFSVQIATETTTVK